MLLLSKLFVLLQIKSKSKIVNYLRAFFEAVKGQNNNDKSSRYLFIVPLLDFLLKML